MPSIQKSQFAARAIWRLPALFALLFAFSPSQAALSQHSLDAASSNPILPGDHPDPTIVRIGSTYWTASTSGDWAPEFPLYRSTDLRHWKAAGAVFPETPEWASGSFWAPEMVTDHGRVLVYYVGRERNGPLCVAVATASRAEGPYTDHGPLICQPDGSIDPSFARDETGKPFLIWKEDGNSEGKPTPIWAQPLSSDLLHLTGNKTQLLVNDPASWEGGVVEGPYIFRHASRFYLFYAGNACCGAECHYAEGVARADHLLGPWTKDPAHPLIPPNTRWKCPGHGTAVETRAGRDYFLYHAYPAAGTVYLGRESVLDEITWNSEGWPVINGGRGPSGGRDPGDALPQKIAFADDFRRPQLDPEWKWPIRHAPRFHTGSGRLTLDASADGNPVFVARSLMAAAYVATVGVDAEGGMGLIGDAHAQLVLARHGGRLDLVRVAGGDRKVLWQGDVQRNALIWLRVRSAGRVEATFSYSFDRQNWTDAGPPVSLAGLPLWDQGVRVGLVNGGPAGSHASFVDFSLLDGSN